MIIQNILKVHAFWDKDAEVWVATSENVPGLVTEPSTIESLTQKLREMIPELLVLNRIVPAVDPQQRVKAILRIIPVLNRRLNILKVRSH
ncbi:DUF1902 domain-containing protein [Nostoc sp.]|uniref:DUF1902 domain-containing protein n=1 Tax=Nostoc sp. TaxID=1180 RepID=UPI002FF53FDC